ncbi:hypothetical protein C0J52_21471, partial [Blattella germanica]
RIIRDYIPLPYENRKTAENGNVHRPPNTCVHRTQVTSSKNFNEYLTDGSTNQNMVFIAWTGMFLEGKTAIISFIPQQTTRQRDKIMHMHEDKIPNGMLQMKPRGKRPRGRLTARWLDHDWMEMQVTEAWKNRDHWRFLCNSRPKIFENDLRKKVVNKIGRSGPMDSDLVFRPNLRWTSSEVMRLPRRIFGLNIGAM